MNRYDSYKDSGVEWIGEIPTNWKSKRFSYSIDIQKGKIPKNLTDKKLVDSLPYLSMGVLRGDEPLEFSNESGVVHVSKGDIGLLWDGSNSGEVIRINREGILSSTVSLLSLKDDSIDKEFSFYLLKFYENDFRENTIGMGIPHVSGDHVRESKLIIPPLSEQQQIVSFLDTKTSLIDSLIEKTQRKIELLKEKRTSIINEVVTKGLNPNVEMRDSGVEWIGEIPIHWETGKLKNNSDLKISSIDKHIFEEEIQVIVCNYTDVYYNEFITSELPLRKGSCSENEYSNFILKRGDVIITKDSESPTDIGVPSLVKENLDNVVCGYHLSIIKSNPKKLVGGYLFRQLQTNRIRSYFEINSNGITRFGLGKSSVLETPLILPPTSEQQQIVEYLDEQTQLIDKTISIEEKRIELLKEYRQSLISEVVTGKRKVV